MKTTIVAVVLLVLAAAPVMAQKVYVAIFLGSTWKGALEVGKGVVRKAIPINRLGKPDELKSTALYLATCPPFMTGSEIYIDGGHGHSLVAENGIQRQKSGCHRALAPIEAQLNPTSGRFRVSQSRNTVPFKNCNGFEFDTIVEDG